MKRTILSVLAFTALALAPQAQAADPPKSPSAGYSIPGKSATILSGANSGSAALALPWAEREGAWYGDWTPVPHNPGVFEASWRRPNSRDHASAHLRISITGYNVTVARTQDDGKSCNYRGEIVGLHVTGTYRCAGSRDLLPWSADVVTP